MNSFKNKNGIKLPNVYVLNRYLLSECLSKAKCDFISKNLMEDGLHDKKAVRQERGTRKTWRQEPTWGRGRTLEITLRQAPGLLYTRPRGQAIPAGAGQKLITKDSRALSYPLTLCSSGNRETK